MTVTVAPATPVAQRHPDCELCQRGEPHHPLENEPKYPSRYLDRFEPSPGLRYGWNVDCTFHGRFTRTPIIHAHFILKGIGHMDRTSRLAIHHVPLPHDWQRYDNWDILGSIERQEDSGDDERIKPGLWVGHFLILADREGTKSVITLPLAHIFQHYTWDNPD